MKTLQKISATIVLLVVASGHCLAEMMLEDISKARATEMGVSIRSHLNGDAGMAVWLEFESRGVWKDFARVELSIRPDDKHLVSVPLLVTRSPGERVTVHFSADPSVLAASVFTIAVADGTRGGSGYRFKVRDFIDVEKSR